MDRFELEERLIDFAVLMLNIAKLLPDTYAGKHLGSQLIRSGTSPALNYGEAQSAESRKDFIHKNKIVLKELRESRVCLKIVAKSNLLDNKAFLDQGLKESNELISIFVKTTKTALENTP
ncbi:MAG: four helix bundle protein [Bacteroidales bacterium]|nr:four helix bundle protein [Bacteroidales bacterium]